MCYKRIGNPVEKIGSFGIDNRESDGNVFYPAEET